MSTPLSSVADIPAGIQSVVVATVVAYGFAHAAWALMPQSARRAMATCLLHLPWSTKARSRLQKTVQPSVGAACGACDGCANTGKTITLTPTTKLGGVIGHDIDSPDTARPLVFHPQRR